MRKFRIILTIKDNYEKILSISPRISITSNRFFKKFIIIARSKIVILDIFSIFSYDNYPTFGLIKKKIKTIFIKQTYLNFEKKTKN